MKKEIFVVLGLFAIIFSLVIISNITEPRGEIIPWKEVEYGYKNYYGEPGIDTSEFYEIVMKKNYEGSCRPLYTLKYDKENISTKMMAEDKDAIVEFIARKLSRDIYAIPDDKEFKIYGMVSKPGKNINLNIMKAMSEDKAETILDSYIEETPFAAYMKLNYITRNSPEDKETQNELYSILKKAGGYYFGMAKAVAFELEEYGQTDTEIFCEAYYNGCDLYKMKIMYNITCDNTSYWDD